MGIEVAGVWCGLRLSVSGVVGVYNLTGRGWAGLGGV